MSEDMGEVPIPAQDAPPPIDSPHMTQAHPVDLGGKVAGALGSIADATGIRPPTAEEIMQAARTGEMVPDETMAVLRMGEMPTFWAGPEWRNGREAGAYLAGIVLMIPEKQAHVTVPETYADGAVAAMISGGLTVTPFSRGGESATYAVRVADRRWGADPAQ
jgi:hypothetical protein